MLDRAELACDGVDDVSCHTDIVSQKGVITDKVDGFSEMQHLGGIHPLVSAFGLPDPFEVNPSV